MEIGGNDFTFSCPMTQERLQLALDIARRRWPAAHYEDDNFDGTFPGLVAPAIPCTIFVYRTAEAFAAIRRDGVTDALQDEMFFMVAETNALHFVIGNDDSEADHIRQEIERALSSKP